MRFDISLALLFTALVGLTSASMIHPRKDGNNNGNGITTVANLKNTACKNWYAIRDAILGGLFHGTCNDLARGSIRLAFHDAGTFSKKLQSQGIHTGGADGSMLIDPTEVQRGENNGLQAIVAALRPLAAQFGVSNADIVQAAGALAVIACPGGPSIPILVGRPDATKISPLNQLPDTHDTVPNLVNLFADKGFSAREFMVLIGSHSTARSRFVDPTQANKSMDSTVDIWDVRFYSETQSAVIPNGVFKLPSDVAVAQNQLTAKDFNRFVGNQDNWAREYADAHSKMSRLGVNVTMVDCSEIMPLPIDLSTVSVAAKNSVDPVVDRTQLAAAIQKYRSIWL